MRTKGAQRMYAQLSTEVAPQTFTECKKQKENNIKTSYRILLPTDATLALDLVSSLGAIFPQLFFHKTENKISKLFYKRSLLSFAVVALKQMLKEQLR